MAWEQDDKNKRAKVAHELDRREFWKACYVEGLKYGQGTLIATEMADEALASFEGKFPPLVGS